MSAAEVGHGADTKLFVFGDSYADTGNTPVDGFECWKEPYGVTFPGQPSGRFSDGLVLTDFIGTYSSLMHTSYVLFGCIKKVINLLSFVLQLCTWESYLQCLTECGNLI